jgi:DNA repair exonuclease SbcCD ATPase subunit
MKPLALAIVLAALAATAAPAAGGEKPAPSQGVVDAAKDAKAQRRRSTTKVITNADVKKSKGKVATTPNVSDTPIEPQPTLMEKDQATRAAAKVLAERRAALEKTVAALERDLAAIEQSYYNENDLQRRDTELVKRFGEVKEKLEVARKELAELTPRTEDPRVILAVPPPS